MDGLLNSSECSGLIDFIEKSDPTPAPINTVDGLKRNSDVRNNDRILMKNQELASTLFQRSQDKIPCSIFDFTVLGLNELFRCYRYAPGMKFAPHTDGAFERSENERSFYTFLIYLNEVEKGGETNFFVEPQVSVSPKKGLGVIFQHPITHEGAIVEKGYKYVLRTDVMYQKAT